MKLGRFKEEIENYDDDLDVVIKIGNTLYAVNDVDNTGISLEIAGDDLYRPGRE